MLLTNSLILGTHKSYINTGYGSTLVNYIFSTKTDINAYFISKAFFPIQPQ